MEKLNQSIRVQLQLVPHDPAFHRSIDQSIINQPFNPRGFYRSIIPISTHLDSRSAFKSSPLLSKSSKIFSKRFLRVSFSTDLEASSSCRSMPPVPFALRPLTFEPLSSTEGLILRQGVDVGQAPMSGCSITNGSTAMVTTLKIREPMTTGPTIDPPGQTIVDSLRLPLLNQPTSFDLLLLELPWRLPPWRSESPGLPGQALDLA